MTKPFSGKICQLHNQKNTRLKHEIDKNDN